MTPRQDRRDRLIVLLTAAFVMAATLNFSQAADPSLYPTDYVYLDIDGEPLPFQDHATIQKALRTGSVVHQKLMSRGVANNIKLILEYQDVRFHAVLRVVDVTEKEKAGSHRMMLKYRDSYIFEVAAYQLNELLGIERIPPTVERTVAGQIGSAQIWMERTAPEDVLLEKGELIPPDMADWWRQKTVMWVFDALIANTDRNQGNLLIDDDWNLWFIDHTRAFRETQKLFGIEELETCERRLWAALQNTGEDAIRKRLEGYLTSKELTKLSLRRNKLVKHFRKKIKKHGEDRVLYDYGR